MHLLHEVKEELDWTARELIEDHSGGMADGHSFKGYLPGGPSGGILPVDMADIPLDYGQLEQHGSFVGAHAVVILSDKDDMKDVALNLLKFFEDESCGQCTPCRAGTGWLYRMLTRIVEGKGTYEDIARLDDVASKIEGRTICALGDAAAMPVRSFLKHFREEFEYYVEHKKSMVKVA